MQTRITLFEPPVTQTDEVILSYILSYVRSCQSVVDNPTFVTASRNKVLYVTLESNGFSDQIRDWHIPSQLMSI